MAGKRKDKKGVNLRTGESQREDGRYQYRWTDENHKRHTIYANTLKELREKEKQIQQDIADGISTANRSMTVVELCEMWLNLKRVLKPKTIESYDNRYRHQIKPFFENVKISSVKKSDVVRFYYHLDDKGYSFQTIQQTHNVLKQVFDMAIEDRLLKFNPTSNALKDLRKRAANEQEPVESLTVSEQKEFFNYIENHPYYRRNKLLFAFLVETGLRIGEALALQWSDIDFAENTIHIERTLLYIKRNEKCENIIQSPKSKKSVRTIPMNHAARVALETHRKQLQERGQKCRVKINGYNDFVFINTKGGVMTMSNINKELKRICSRHNEAVGVGVLLPHITCHKFRHTYATRMTENGMNLKVLQKLLGHSKADTTMNVYINTSMEYLQQEVQRVDSTPIFTPNNRQVMGTNNNIYHYTFA